MVLIIHMRDLHLHPLFTVPGTPFKIKPGLHSLLDQGLSGSVTVMSMCWHGNRPHDSWTVFLPELRCILLESCLSVMTMSYPSYHHWIWSWLADWLLPSHWLSFITTSLSGDLDSDFTLIAIPILLALLWCCEDGALVGDASALPQSWYLPQLLVPGP